MASASGSLPEQDKQAKAMQLDHLKQATGTFGEAQAQVQLIKSRNGQTASMEASLTILQSQFAAVQQVIDAPVDKLQEVTLCAVM